MTKLLFITLSFALISCSSDSDDPVDTVDVGMDAQEDASALNNEHDSGPDAPANDVGVDATDDLLLERYSLSGSTLFPEGIEFDPVTRRFLLGSLTTGVLTAVDAAGIESEFAPPQRAGWVTLGLAIDPSARLIWVCARSGEGEGANALWLYDIDSGDAVSEIDLGAAESDAQCNDIVLDSNGVAYITDPANGRVYTTSSDGPPSTVVESPTLAAAIPGTGPNGLVLTPDEQTLIVGILASPQLIAIPLAAPETLFAIQIDGDWFGAAEFGPDGLVEYDGDVIVVSDSAVRRVSIDLAQQNGTSSRLEVQESGFSTGVLAEGELYVVKSEVASLVLGREPNLPFAITRIPLGE